MLWIVILGIATGARALTPMAVLCWFMWFALLPVTRFNFWEAYVASVAVFSLLALGEYYGDTLATTPSRKSIFPLLSRIVLSAVVGASIASSLSEPLIGGILFGIIGALIGVYGGYALRMSLARKVGSDLPVALAESAIALLLSIVAMHQVIAGFLISQHQALLRSLF